MRRNSSGSRPAAGARRSDGPTAGAGARRAGAGVGNDRERRGHRAARSERRSRAQTTIDFTVGVSIFLLVVASVFAFVPGTLEPFAEGGQEEIVSANRIGDSLAEGLLGDPARPHVLNTTCAVGFFESGTPPDGCRYSGTDLTERVGVKDRQPVNVTIRSNLSADSDGSDILCWDEDAGSPGRVVERDSASCDSTETQLRIGPSPPRGSGTAVTARRVVEINGTDATLLVEMW